MSKLGLGVRFLGLVFPWAGATFCSPFMPDFAAFCCGFADCLALIRSKMREGEEKEEEEGRKAVRGVKIYFYKCAAKRVANIFTKLFPYCLLFYPSPQGGGGGWGGESSEEGQG